MREGVSENPAEAQAEIEAKARPVPSRDVGKQVFGTCPYICNYFLKVPQIPMPQTCEIAAKIAVCKNSRALKSVVKRGSKNSRERVAILVC